MTPPQVPVIAIDGPSGSGKGTVAAVLAARLGWHLLDSGALYRLVALAAAEHGVALDAADELAGLAATMRVAFRPAADGRSVELDGRDVTAELRAEATSRAASEVAAVPAVRTALLERQRGFIAAPGLVADGRDMGTAVFPDAALKVFLTATPAERAQRRYKQLKEKGIDVSLHDLSRDIAERDRRDASRPVSPLRPAEDARVLDSTSLSVADVVARIMAWVDAEGLSRP